MSPHSKRRRAFVEPINPRQQDLFAAVAAPPVPATPAIFSAPPVKQVRTKLPELGGKAKPTAPVKAPPPALGADDWWTTRSVCAFLKIGRKALWNMRRDPASDFPAPVDAVGHRHLYLAADVRSWMEAQREGARQRAQERRQALTQFS